ncbi:class I SAM-dependent DNA methyltransferase [Actinomadura sp. CNU-125]|uniref:HsdM family class I SAM-dependent methyltransferase n=1 Tax=Actinomadura sp. CNU-125 TaxID=1904961 RepID=UPI000A7E0087|nr:SAM-dependent methyltransferase [Actinomadura sp. CNU-125]
MIGRFADLDLRPSVVNNHQMGYVFEDLIRRFAEASNETAGEHFTPREVIELMVNLLLEPDHDALTVPGTVRTVLDPACGTGGMLTAAEEHIRDMNTDATVKVYGQELNPHSWAICRSDLMIKGQDPDNVKLGNSFSDDGHKDESFDYVLANPPFGVEWKNVKDEVEWEHNNLTESGRFSAGLPRINDGSLLFLQHMISKMKPREKGGSRIAIVFNGSPLFTGAAGSGESEIRRWILENDWLEGIVALPDQLFYNTGISTYFWVLTNRKNPDHRGKVMLVDAREHFAKMRKSLGDKRKYITRDQIEDLTRLYSDALQVAKDAEHPLHGKAKVFKNEDFGYRRITVERPLKLRFEVTDATLEAIRDSAKLENHINTDTMADALRPLVGKSWGKKLDAYDAIREALNDAGLLWPGKQPFANALRDIVGVRDPDGEVQMKKKEPEPDSELRDFENVPLDEDVEEYLRREYFPTSPTPGSTTPRPRSATRSPSPATSMSTPRPAP